jgi:membrane protein implicated in regulation of membrane protease activity
MLFIQTGNALPGPRGRSWLQTAILAVLGITLAVVAFFFVAIALVAGACLALVLAVRWWWIVRRLRAANKTAGPLEGDYVVIEEPRSERSRR